jgi:hypothetical protein
MIEIVFTSSEKVNSDELSKVKAGLARAGCACCMCAPDLMGAGDETAKHTAVPLPK